MAKVIGPLHSTEARGRVDSLVYNTWRGIRYVRAYVAPQFGTPDPRAAQKARVGIATLAWPNLTPAQRLSWGHYADQHPRIDWTGIPIRITGFDAYVSLSVRVQRLAATPLATPPSTPLPYPISTLTLSQVANAIRCAWTYPTQPTPHTYYLQLRQGGPYSAGRQPPFDHSVIKAHELINSSPHDLAFTVSGHYGIWGRVVDLTTGEVSPLLTADINVTLQTTGTVIGHLHEQGTLNPIPNLNVTCGGKSDLSDADGNFEILLVPAGAQIVTPDPTNYTWSPDHKDIVVVANQTYDSGTFEGAPT